MAIVRFDAPTLEALCAHSKTPVAGSRATRSAARRSRRSFDADQLNYSALDAEEIFARAVQRRGRRSRRGAGS